MEIHSGLFFKIAVIKIGIALSSAYENVISMCWRL